MWVDLVATTTISESPGMSPPAESTRVGTPKPRNPPKRGRPISTDEASLDPATAKQREIFRNRKRATLQRKIQRKAIEKEQEILAKTLAATNLNDRETQEKAVEQISTRPWRPSGDAAPLRPIVEDIAAPADFEGARITGFDELPDIGEGYESEQLEFTNARTSSPERRSKTNTPDPAQAEQTRSKGKQKAVAHRDISSTPAGTIGRLDTSFRTASVEPVPSARTDATRSPFSPTQNDFGSDIGADGSPDLRALNVDSLDKQAAIDHVIQLSIKDFHRQGIPLPEDRTEGEGQDDTLLGAAILVQIAHSRKLSNRKVY